MRILYTIAITFLLTLGLSYLIFSDNEEKEPRIYYHNMIPIRTDTTCNSTILDTVSDISIIKLQEPTSQKIKQKKRKKKHTVSIDTTITEKIETLEHLIAIKKASETKIYHFEKELAALERSKNIFNKRKREEKITMTKEFLSEARISLQQINVRIKQHMEEKKQ